LVEKLATVKQFHEIEMGDVGKTIVYMNGDTIISGIIASIECEVLNTVYDVKGIVAHSHRNLVTVTGPCWDATIDGPSDSLVTIYSRKQ
jgi:hypothetical protein